MPECTGVRAVRGLLLACHPLPCLAVTGFTAAWAWARALDGAVDVGRLLTVCLAVLLGQLSIGWSNDAVDADRDVAAGRSDKPIPRGLVGRSAVAAAAAVAAVCCVPASLALGAAAGTVHLVAVASAWAYNLDLKRRVISPLPYAVSFGLLPAVVQTWPPPAVMAGAALLGVAAHFANTVADVAADAATGVRGLPQRLGPATSLRVCAASLALAGVALIAAAGQAPPVGLVVLGSGAAIAIGVAVAGTRWARWTFRLIVAAVALVLAGFLIAARAG
jgi:4-hydroxybenzoate polyprenyltransferase